MAGKIGDVKRKVLSTSTRKKDGKFKTQQVVYLTAEGKKNGKMRFSSVTKHEPLNQ